MVLSRRVAELNKKALNRVMVHVAPRLPGFAVLHHRGRTSGARYDLPINVFVRGDRYVFALTYGSDTDWLKNVLAQGGAAITTRGRVVALTRPRVYTDVERRDVPAVPRWILGRVGVTEFLEMWRVPTA
ncbi:conserved hypothetical protein [Beutenbergia cavernae DSM 12333]|uniref:Nitroreductase family deazaflavin-dependent oxidoreductase n=1 Tax=Beutenbergia cavernae (strain ATCC BAA-8 / DSM 12333 / CCUG 43141 / JCM 11478 / NBRC 16432 / NCIMB 13614 / HKI 0122) TaxID=471853 RepID=C5BZL9_BEUC1|nr:nitroreductase family deazaflavin-dependent oxidoreductase [Beutenbergia cavernae]ACQ79191.1 conserved hypothetical protein [Beutenbergia cavernae DSM 12333]